MCYWLLLLAVLSVEDPQLPHPMERFRFGYPDYAAAHRQRVLARKYRESVDANYNLDIALDRGYADRVLYPKVQDAVYRDSAWQMLADALFAYPDSTKKQRAEERQHCLATLKKIIGEEAYKEGRMPSPYP